MRILGMTAPEALVLLAGAFIPILILYWTVRFAVKHGITDALRERGEDGSRKLPEESTG